MKLSTLVAGDCPRFTIAAPATRLTRTWICQEFQLHGHRIRFRLCRPLEAIRISRMRVSVGGRFCISNMPRVKSSIASDKWQVRCTIKRKRYKLSKPLAIAKYTLHNLLWLYDNTRAPSIYFCPATNTSSMHTIVEPNRVVSLGACVCVVVVVGGTVGPKIIIIARNMAVALYS